ncbi:hypothetical protein BH09BAC1_BH09BAC1_13320 [soil metagenome]
MLNVKERYVQLEACQDDGERLEILFNLATDLLNFDQKRVLEIAEEINEIAERGDNNLGRSYYHSTKGRVFFKRAKYADCEMEFNQALQMALLTTDLITQAMCYDSLGILYSFQYRHEASLEASFKALSIYQQVPGITSEKFTVVCYNNIGACYKQMFELDKAEDSYLKGLEAAKSHEGRVKYSIMNNLANIKIIQGKFDEGLVHVSEALKGFRQANHKNGEANALVITGHCWLGKGAYAVAMTHLLSAIKLLKELDYKTVEISALYGMGNVYMKMEAFDEAIKHYQKALALAIAIEDDHEVCEIYLLLIPAYQATNDLDAINEAINIGLGLAKKRNLKRYVQSFENLMIRA